MSINEGKIKLKNYLTDSSGNHTIVSYWTSSDTVELNNGKTLEETISDIEVGACIKDITLAEYNQLTEAEKNDGTIYNITDYPTNELSINADNVIYNNQTVKTALDEKYSKPDTGIPESDLSQDVQNKLNNSSGDSDCYVKPEGGIPKSDLEQSVQDALDNIPLNSDFVSKVFDSKDEYDEFVTSEDYDENADYYYPIVNNGEETNGNIYIKPNTGIPKNDLSQDLQEKINQIGNSGSGGYVKPDTGIPKSDLSQDVQSSLNKADTALQSHQDISGKQDKLTQGTNITITENNVISSTWRGIQDNLTSNSVTDSLSANQGKVLKGLIDNVPTGSYSKPSGGIPESDLSQDVQNKLNNSSGGSGGSGGSGDYLAKTNPSGTGSLSLNRKANTTIGLNSVTLGKSCEASGDYSVAMGNNSISFGDNSFAFGGNMEDFSVETYTCTINEVIEKGLTDYKTIYINEELPETMGLPAYLYKKVNDEIDYTNRYGIFHFSIYFRKQYGLHTLDGLSVGDTIVIYAYKDNNGENKIPSIVSKSNSFSFGLNQSYEEGAFASGYNTIAAGKYSHSEGDSTRANGLCSHVEGYSTSTINDYCHSEGNSTHAQGLCGHAEGGSCSANGDYSHAEGNYSHANGLCSHSEGYLTMAHGSYSHVNGYETTMSSYAGTAIGIYNKENSNNGNKTGNLFEIGNGTTYSKRKNAFSISYTGVVKAESTITGSTTADYAEFFEWSDGNPNDIDRVGYFVTFDDGDKIRIATNEDDYILGIVSGQPCVLGNGDCDVWTGMVMKDDFRRIIYEPTPMTEDYVDEETNEIKQREVEGRSICLQPMINPEYDSTLTYISRFDRPEWSPIGMLGILAVRQDGTLELNKYCTVNENGIATKCEKNHENSYRVIKIKSTDVAEIVLK